MRYRTKVVEVEAIRYTGINPGDVQRFCETASPHSRGDDFKWIQVLDRFANRVVAVPGDYIVKRDDGYEVHVGHIFEKFHELVEVGEDK